MLPLELFKRRNFAIGNVQTFAMYRGLGITFFLLALYLCSRRMRVRAAPERRV